MSAIGSVIFDPHAYQLLLITPGTSPASDNCRKQIRQSWNFLMNPRGLPQRLQRLWYRTVNFFFFASFATADVRAIRSLLLALRPKRHPKLLQKFPRFVVGPRGRHNRDVHSPDLIHLRVIDFREDQLIAQTQRVISAAIEGLRRYAAKIADAGKHHT